jgi:hypothetical protein
MIFKNLRRQRSYKNGLMYDQQIGFTQRRKESKENLCAFAHFAPLPEIEEQRLVTTAVLNTH